ncbi:hypothetical protein GGF46_004508, partial [Coemansia sp. RSA 552]
MVSRQSTRSRTADERRAASDKDTGEPNLAASETMYVQLDTVGYRRKRNVLSRLWAFLRPYAWLGIVGIWLAITGYFIAALVLQRKTQLSDILPLIFLYVLITAKLLFSLVSTRYITEPLAMAIDPAMVLWLRIPRIHRYLFGVVVLLAIMLSVSLSLPDSKSGTRIERMQSLLGVAIIVLGLVVTSKHPRHIQWRVVIVGTLMQFSLGCIVVKTQWGSDLFTWLADMARSLLDFSRYGTEFLFGDDILSSNVSFVLSVFPAVIFFASLVQMVSYFGGMQWLLRNLGRVFQKLLDTSGTESVVAAGSPFLGQVENALLVKDYLEYMTKSEIHACMTAGFATVSGSVFQGYIALGVDPKSIITACIMSIPCSLALSKIRYPETEESLTRGRIAEPPRQPKEVNFLHAIGNGAATGVNLCLLMTGSLLAIISMVHLADFFLTWFGEFISISGLTLELILGYVLYPYAWLLGVPKENVYDVSQLLGLKFISNEFVAYQRLNDSSDGPSLRSLLTDRGRTIADFALCGFGNLNGIALQVGSLGALAPSRKGDFSRLALSACITGSIATTVTAAIISM